MADELPEIQVTEVDENYQSGHKQKTFRVRAKTVSDAYKYIEKLRKK